MSYFEYYTGLDKLPADAFKISPSRLSSFLDSTPAWYRENLLGEEGFTGNTSSHLGTVVHGLASMYIKEGVVRLEEAEAYINSITDPEVDKEHIRNQYYPMFEALRQQYLVTVTAGDESEGFYLKEVKNNCFLAGSIDLLRTEQGEIVDFKTTGSLTAPDRFSRAYFFQLLAYAWLCRKLGYDIHTIRLVYITQNVVGRISDKTGKPLKDYPTTISHVTHQVTAEDMDMLEGILNLVAESVNLWKEKPELRHILAQDYRLKEKPKLTL